MCRECVCIYVCSYIICLELTKYEVCALFYNMHGKGNKANYCKMKINYNIFIQMYEKVKNKNILTVDNVKSVLQDKFPHANIWDILGVYSKYDDERKVSWNENF